MRCDAQNRKQKKSRIQNETLKSTKRTRLKYAETGIGSVPVCVRFQSEREREGRLEREREKGEMELMDTAKTKQRSDGWYKYRCIF